ncbi:helix-turn-helix domain-containing protein [Actinoplanes regularis]|uniref:MerR HTH family regulatory protein n=1 Tax=Actinoplanes regularis TaxID=52697 RepID=A0A239A921_9ACTN|nr:MerR family transcriptional regulator [Actinoplanes regularis]GIE87018.1 hypothetical protein Are01nite_34980 [Actinoplanes regularis]SNR91922.1 MerR HTH family regulatory protein [Actinoplanes regularis]
MWTMEELVDRVRTALAAEYSGAPNGRVRDLPDPRSIRWYSTIGLVDRPLGTRGRNALYGPRHLLQLVAVKRLQAAGRTLAEIQAELSGVSEEALTELARVPSELLAADPPPPPPATPRAPFWKAPPAAPAPPELTPDWSFPEAADRLESSPPGSITPTGIGPLTGAFPTAPPGMPEVPPPLGDLGGLPLNGLLTGVPLGAGVILLVPGALHLDYTDRAELATLARPLLDLLASRGLTDRRES